MLKFNLLMFVKAFNYVNIILLYIKVSYNTFDLTKNKNVKANFYINKFI